MKSRIEPKLEPLRCAYGIQFADGACLVTDLDTGSVSVTNDAERIVPFLLWAYGYYRRIIYRDSEGHWDEMKHDGKAFTGFAPIDAETRERYRLVDES